MLRARHAQLWHHHLKNRRSGPLVIEKREGGKGLTAALIGERHHRPLRVGGLQQRRIVTHEQIEVLQELKDR